MKRDVDKKPVREAVAVFETAETLQAAIDELLISGFNRAELSLLAGEHAVEEKLGHHYTKSLKTIQTCPQRLSCRPNQLVMPRVH